MNLLRLVVAVLCLGGAVGAQAEVNLSGKMEQGALIRGQAQAGTQVWLNGEPVKVSPEGLFAFGFEREATLNQELKLIYPDGLTQLMPLKISEKQYKITGGLA